MANPSEKKAKAMNALTKEQLIHGINQGREASFSRHLGHLQTRLDLMIEEERRQEREEGHQITKDTNEQAADQVKTTNKLTKVGLWLVAVGILVTALIGIFGGKTG